MATKKTTQTVTVKKTSSRTGPRAGKRSWKVTDNEKQFIISAAIDGNSLTDISKLYAKEFKKSLAVETVRYHVLANREKILAERNKDLERSKALYPYAGFEGRVKELTETIEKLKRTKKASVAKYKAIGELLKIIGQEEIALRLLILKEVAAGVGEENTTWELELKQVIEELSEENKQIVELGKIAGW